MTRAPDFGPGYPSAGERIGPAWQATWDRMADGQWHKGMDLGAEIAERFDLTTKTVQMLLGKAAKIGLIERETRFKGKVGGYKTRTNVIRPAYFRREL